MLTLTRRLGQTILIGNDIKVTVMRDGRNVRLAVTAPKSVGIFREEIVKAAAAQYTKGIK